MPADPRRAKWSLVRGEALSALDLIALEEATACAARAWPTVIIDDDDWLPFLSARLPAEACAEALTRLRVEELWLVCGALRRDPAALAAFDHTHRSMLTAALRRVTPGSQTEDDVIQLAYAKLLVGDETHPPALSSYGGRGSLEGWLRLTAVRIALDLRRASDGRELPLDDQRVAWPDAAANPELDLLRQRYAVDFKAAFEHAMGTLSPRARNVLRQQVLHRLSLEQMAQLHHVHRSAVARWLADARAALLLATRDALGARIGASRAEVDSLIAVLHSQLDVSIERLLAPETEPADADG